MLLQRIYVPLKKDVVDGKAANDVAVLRAGVDVVLIGLDKP